MPNTVNQVKRLIGFVQFFQIFLLSLEKNVRHFTNLQTFTQKSACTITNGHHESFNTLKADLGRATDLTLLSAKPGLQCVIQCDASFHGTGFVLRIEDYLIEKVKPKKITLQFFLFHDFLQQLN